MCLVRMSVARACHLEPLQERGEDEVGDALLRHRHAVQDHLAAAHLDRVAGQADDALDDVMIGVLGIGIARRGIGRAEHDDVAARGVAAEQTAGDRREAVRQRPA